MNVIKRDGRVVKFDADKIRLALTKSSNSVEPDGQLSSAEIINLTELIAKKILFLGRDEITVEGIQDLVEDELIASNHKIVAKHYITYRYEKAAMRKLNTTDEAILTLLGDSNEALKYENSNKNPVILSTQRDYMAGEVSKDLSKRYLIPEDIWEAHEKGIIHFHDADYFAQKSHNCDVIDLDDMLQNGTCISGTHIDRPHSFLTACNIATQIIAQVASSQYGGQTITLSHLAPFVDVSRKRIRNEVIDEFKSTGLDASLSQINDITEARVKNEVKHGVQTIQYQILTLMTTNGQSPFVSICMYLNEVPEGQTKDDLALIIEEVLKQRIQGVKNEKGHWITPAFPKLLYVLEPDNVTKGSRYWYLTELAAKCTAKRMVPDYISEKIMLEYKIDDKGNGNCYPCMGCRSFLTPYTVKQEHITNTKDKVGEPKYYGRFNQGVITINLVDVALSSHKDVDEFWKIFESRLELCHRALRIRHEHLLGTSSDVAPILWQYGALARLKKGEKIDKLLYNGYSTISLGYAGLYECVKYMTGKSHTDEEARPFAMQVMQKLNDKCKEWKLAEHIDYSVYGTPLESTTYKFAQCLQNRFGKIEGITDHDYITNSYHVNVRENIDAFTKLKFEAPFMKLSPGGAISYVEVPNMQNNIPAVLDVIQFIYDNIMYAELNTKSDYCQECGYEGEIEIVSDGSGKLIWKCPNCGNTDQDKMNIARRTCGYIGTHYWNQGRTQEIKDRVLHL